MGFSLHVLLSMMKEESFVCHEARITTRDLEYRNQTWSVRLSIVAFIQADRVSPVRRVGRPIHSFRYFLERMGEDGVQSASCSSPSCRSGAAEEDKTDTQLEKSSDDRWAALLTISFANLSEVAFVAL